VVGGGIGGLATALSLAEIGADVHVYDGTLEIRVKYLPVRAT
jgi:2-polyprenyl-6-methoxyphenol hydroxylase-like FAD-dependent oxidoreductase